MNAGIWSYWRLILGWALFVLIAAAASVQFAGFTTTRSLPISAARSDSGCAYVVQLSRFTPAWPLTRFNGDAPSSDRSDLLLFESGRQIGPPHASHVAIRDKGLGRYSHWNDTLYFSATDCSDPRANGRSYTITASVSPSRTVLVAAILAIISLVYLIKTSAIQNNTLRSLRDFASNSLYTLVSPPDRSRQRVIGVTLFIVLLLGCMMFLAWEWSGNGSASLAVGGAYQISDALAYWTCANSLLDIGNFGNKAALTVEWCQRRAIYPSFLAGIALLGHQNIFAALAIQALIALVAIFAVVQRSFKHVGILGGVACALLLVRYATVHGLSVTLTENAGLIFGCLGLAILLRASEKRSLAWSAIGIATISIALNARAGAFFVLPSLIVWAGMTAHYLQFRIKKWIVAASIAALAGFAIQSLLVLAVGGSPTNSHGNFSYTLYGLSVGGAGWQQILTDHPEIFIGSDASTSKAIYSLAWDNLKAQPEAFLLGLYKGFTAYLTVNAYVSWPWSTLLKACWWAAWIPICLRRRNPVYLLTGLCSLGVLFSAPFLIVDGGPRVFAATIAIDILQIGIGVSWIGTILTGGTKRSFASPTVNTSGVSLQHRPAPVFELVYGATLVAIFLVPYTPLRQISADQLHSVERCNDDEHTVLTTIGNDKGSMLLDIVDDDRAADLSRGEIGRQKLFKQIPAAAWYREQLMAFNGNSLLTAHQLDFGDKVAPGPYTIFSNIHLAREYFGADVRLCVDKEDHQLVFDTPYRKLNSIHLLSFTD